MEQVADEKTPVKRRRLPRWAKIAISPLIVLAALAAAWGGWLLVELTMLDMEVAKIRQRGEPVCAADLARPSVPPERNAATMLQQAGIRLLADCNSLERTFVRQLKADGWNLFCSSQAVTYPELRQQYQKELAAIAEASRPALAMIRQSRDLTECDWETDSTRSILAFSGNGLLLVGRLLTLNAILANASGQDAEAIEYIQDLFIVGNRSRNDPSSGGCLLGWLYDNSGVEAIQNTYMHWGTPANPRSASRKQIEDMIVMLRSEEPMKKALVDSYLSGRVDFLQMTLGVSTHVAWKVPEFGPYLRQVLEMDRVRIIRTMGKAVEAARQADYPAAASKLGPQMDAEGFDLPESFWHPLGLSEPSGMGFYLHYRAVALRRMAATALAIRLFELDHGRKPAALQELVGKYLKNVPTDPFDKDGGPIRYLPTADPPRLYSVNVDGVDEAGSYYKEPEFFQIRKTLDLPFFLDRVPPPQPLRRSSTAPN